MKSNENFNRKFSVFKLLFFFFLVISCDNISDENQVTTLTGKWIWTKSYGGMLSQTITPQSSGRKIMIEFTADSTFKYYLNGKLELQTTFSLKRIEGEQRMLIVYKAGILGTLVNSLNLDKLVLEDFADDGFEHTYRK